MEVAPCDWETHNAVREDPSGRFLCYTLQSRGKPPTTVIRDLGTGRERFLAEALYQPSWSPDGRMVAGEDVREMLTLCPVSGQTCAALTSGYDPVWTADGQALYFLRTGAARTTPDLWRMDLDTRTEKKIATLGPFRSIDRHFDLSRDGRIASAPFREGRYEIWLADLQ